MISPWEDSWRKTLGTTWGWETFLNWATTMQTKKMSKKATQESNPPNLQAPSNDFFQRVNVNTRKLWNSNKMFAIQMQMRMKHMCSAGGKKKAIAFPELEGEESVQDFLAKYKRQCLSRKSLLRDLQERIAEEKPISGQNLALIEQTAYANFLSACSHIMTYNVLDLFLCAFSVKRISGKTSRPLRRSVATMSCKAHFYWRCFYMVLYAYWLPCLYHAHT